MRAAPVLVVACSAVCGALLAHAAIDVAGDLWLAHDTYDAIGHDSRSVVAAIAVIMLGAFVSRFLSIDPAEIVPRNTLVFVAATVVATIAAVLAMEALDCAAAGRAIDDLGDLFGGSLVLGLSISTVAAVAVALVTRSTLRRLFAFRGAIVRIARSLFLRRARGHAQRAIAERRVRFDYRPEPSARSRRAERGPPSSSNLLLASFEEFHGSSHRAPRIRGRADLLVRAGRGRRAVGRNDRGRH